MPLQFSCPTCQERFDIRVNETGKLGRCTHCGAVVELPDNLASGGYALDGFVIRQSLGSGRFGSVYEADNPQTGQKVALRIPYDDLFGGTANAAAFSEKLKCWQDIEHPYIVRILASGQTDGVCFYAMEFVGGGNLTTRLSQGRLDEREALRILDQLADGLQHLHERQVTPFGLTPSTVIFDEEGNAKWCDLPLVGETDLLSSIYALGALFYEMLTGQMPPGDADDNALAGSLTAVGVSAGVSSIARKLLARETPERFQSVSELLRMMRAPSTSPTPAGRLASAPKYITLKPRGATPATTPETAAEPTPRSSRMTWAVVGLLVLAAAVAAWWWTSRPQPQPAKPAIKPLLALPASTASVARVTAAPTTTVAQAASTTTVTQAKSLPVVQPPPPAAKPVMSPVPIEKPATKPPGKGKAKKKAAPTEKPLTISNPGFENGLDKWTSRNTGGRTLAMAEAARSGKFGARFIDDSTTKSPSLLSPSTPATQGKTYRGRFWVRIRSGAAVSAHLQFFDKDEKPLLVQGEFQSKKIPADRRDWQEVVVEREAIPNTASVFIRVHGFPAGMVEADVDDFSVSELVP